MQIFKLTTVSKMNKGAKDETYGYSYWCEVEGDLRPVKFSSHKEITDGNMVGTEEQVIVRPYKNGEYIQLKAVKLLESPTESVLAPPQAPANPQPVQTTAPVIQMAPAAPTQPTVHMTTTLGFTTDDRALLQTINQKLDQLLNNDAKLDVVHEVTGEPVDLNQIPDFN